MATFIQKLWTEYPIPQHLSCWGTQPGVPAVASLSDLIDVAIDETASDIQINASVEASGMITQMPEGTITCKSATLSGIYPFQGNRLIKVTYEPSSRRAYLRYYPAIIAYSRKLKLEDLEDLKGDRLIYIKSYIFWKMAEKDISILKTANMAVDNGQVDLSVLEEFRKERKAMYERLKEEILMYSTVN